MTMTEREMQDLATNILKSNDCGWDGRKKGEVNSKQASHERKMKPSPMGGQPPRR